MAEFNIFECVEYTCTPRSSGVDEAERYFERAIACFGNGQTQAAIKHLGEAISRDPSHANAFIMRGNAFAALGDQGRSIKDYSEAIRVNPRDASTKEPLRTWTRRSCSALTMPVPSPIEVMHMLPEANPSGPYRTTTTP